MARNDHALGFELVRRAEAAGVHVLVMTVDVPVRTTRPREVVVGLGGGRFDLDPRKVVDIATSPGWLAALLAHGHPRFANLRPYAGETVGTNEVIAFARREIGGAFTWGEIARFREAWKRPLVLKGIMHPADAERAAALGIEGIWVSNHGGRQIEALPASIDVLPAVAAAVGRRATVMMDSGVRSGLDVIRAVALGAQAAFAGKAFLWGLGALGGEGPGHVLDLLIDEARAALGQIGAHDLAAARSVVVRHPGALHFPAGGRQ
jgi:L-lactate dehydrogenase (cytochrome)